MATYDARDHVEELTNLGCSIVVSLDAECLDFPVCISNAAMWRMPELDFEQGAFQHRGFEGSFKLLLRRVHADVLEARGRYPPETWKDFDAFLLRLESVLTGGSEKLSLEVRDPSGLSHVAAALAPQVATFERRPRDDWALGVNYRRPPVQRSDAESVARLVQKSSHIVALTGAGISVESGITPFRTSTGGDAIWADFDPSSHTCKQFNSNPEAQATYWCVTRKFQRELSAAVPNQAHKFLGMLEKQKKLHAVITQNIDSLHQKDSTGVPEGKVNELHGNARRVVCADNRTRFNPQPCGEGKCDYSCDLGSVNTVDAVPTCPICASPLRAETVLFDQELPAGAVESAAESVKESDLLIVVGSTLIVEPANELPAEALRRGIPVIMVNFDETRYDEHVDVLVRRPAGELFAEVSDILAAGIEDECALACEDQSTQPSADRHAEEIWESSGDEQLYGDADFEQ
mmetsp:Transcript_32334/g.73917  ORF Transcript_32334/g.73917 Transcript_32334/m.73917 type:complete len:461 (+) Transcript_32334:68-1450(+)